MNAKSLVVVLVVAGFAIAAWFAWRGGDGLGDQPTPSTPNASADKDGAPADTEKGGLAADPAVADSGVGADLVSNRTEVESAGPASGDRTVTVRGRLVDGSGQALPDVDLLRSIWPNPDGVDWGVDIGRNSPKHEFQSDSEGRFRFELPHDHSAMISLPGSELVFVNRPPMAHGHKGNQDLGDCLVQHAAIVSGIVKDESGSPIGGVNVTAGYGVSAFGVTSSGTTSEDGTFRLGKLKPGKWTLRTASAQHLPTSEEVTVEAGARVEDIVLVVAAGSAIAGQVVDDLGRPVPDFKVGAKRTEARGVIEVESFDGDEAATTDRGGFFTLAGLSGETATVRAFGPGHSSAFAANVKVGTGNLILRVDRLGVVEGVLRGVDGGPLKGSTVRAVSAGNDEMLTSHGIEGVLQDRAASAKTAADGTFRIEDVRPGTVTVRAEGKQHRPVKQAGIQVQPAQVIKGVQLIADRGAVANLTVLDGEGNPVAGAKVRAEKPPEGGAGSGGFRVRSRRVEDTEDGVRMFGGDESLGSAVTDAEGIAVIPGLPAGSVALHAEHVDFAAAKPVTLPLLRNGSVDATLTLRTPGYAELHITDSDGEAADRALYRVRGPLGASDSGSHNGTSDAEGKAVVGPLAAGNYIAELTRKQGATNIGGATLVLSGEEANVIAGAEQRFRVEAGKTTTVEVRRPLLTRMFGMVTGVDGPVAGCTIEIEKRSQGPSVPGMGGGRSVTTKPDGTFAIDDVERGDYVLRYGRTEQIVKAELELSVPAGLAELRQDLVLRTGKVRVQAWSQVDNAPIANAEVALSRARTADAEPERRETRIMMVSISSDGGSGGDSTMMTIGGQRTKTGADGWAEIDDVPVGDYDVRITHKKHVPGGKKGVVVSELQNADLGRVEMTQAGRIRGKVVDADGQQVRMALVSHRLTDGEEGQPTPAMGGSFTLDALPTGRYVLRAQALSMGAGGPGAYSPEVEIEVKAGETATAELRLPKK